MRQKPLFQCSPDFRIYPWDGTEDSREALLDTIWAYEYRSDIRTVDVHIRRLREKLEENPAEPKYILTKWGVGYYFRK